VSQDERNKDKNELIINYLTLRRIIGWLGVSLPVVVYIGNWLIFTNRTPSCLWPSSNVPYSLSGYYYTHTRGLFTGTFWALGVFLVAYNGYDWRDRLTSDLAGLAAIGIALFPTKPPASSFANVSAAVRPGPDAKTAPPRDRMNAMKISDAT